MADQKNLCSFVPKPPIKLVLYRESTKKNVDSTKRAVLTKPLYLAIFMMVLIMILNVGCR